MEKLKDKVCIYLDDVRTPTKTEDLNGVDRFNWIVVRNYDEFVEKINEIGLENVDIISLDHDLGDSSMSEYFNNVRPNFTLDYNNITEKTGYDCCKFLVNKSMDEEKELPLIYTHSANPIGSANIMGYINNYLMNCRLPQTCVRVQIPHTVND